MTDSERTTAGADDGIWIQSTRGPDDEPVCEITWAISLPGVLPVSRSVAL